MTNAEILQEKLDAINRCLAIPEKKRRAKDYPVIDLVWAKAVNEMLLTTQGDDVGA